MKTTKVNLLRTATQITFLATVLIMGACKTKEDSTAKKEATGTETKAPTIDIHTAVITGNTEALQQHILAGSNINEKDPFGGSSPLISAAVFNKPDAAKMLIDAGADVDFQNNDGSTALHTSAFFCRPE